MKRFIYITLVLVLLTVSGTVAWHFRATQNEYYTDADTIKTPADDARLRDILWQPPTKLPDNINALGQISDPAISHDGMTLYFVRGRAGNNADIYFSQRTPTGWGNPALLMGINSTYDELGPEISADGSALYFYSDRKGGLGGYDLWVTHRNPDSNGWGDAENLGEKLNSDFNDYGPALSPDGQTLYFSSNRIDPDAYVKPVPKNKDQPINQDEADERSYNLYSATFTKSEFAQATPLVSLNTKHNEGSPAVSPFDDFVYFTSDRPGGPGGYDLYRTRQVEGEFQPAILLGDEINTSSHELDPVLSLGGYGLYFASNHPEKVEGASAVGAYNLFYTTSREVYHDIERIPPPSLNFGAWWSRIGPNLLWAMFALSLLLLLWAMMKSLSEKRMGLLAKCMSVSVALHLLLLFLFNVWQVTSSLAGDSKHRGKIQIALASPSSGGEIASQIRGQAGQIEPPAWQESPTERPDNIPEAQPESAQTATNVQRFAMAQQESPETSQVPNDVTHERQQDVPRRDPQQETSNVPTKVEVAIQANPNRIEMAEASPTQPSDSTQPVEMARPNVQVNPAHVQVAQVNPSPNQHRQPTLNEKVSLMPQLITHDVQAANLEQTHIADRPVTTEPYPMSEIAPTVATVARAAQVSEAKIQVAASMTPPPRAEVKPNVVAELSTINARVKRMQPDSVPQPSDTSTVDTQSFAQSSEATPAIDSAQPASKNSVDLKDLVAMKDVALPSMEESSAIAAQETVEVKPKRSKIAEHLRGALAKGPIAQEPSYAIQEFSPEMMSSSSKEKSLADATMEQVADTTPGSTIESTIAWASTETSLPLMTDLSLPTMEEESNSVTEERKSISVKVVELTQPRALSGRDMISDPIPAKTAYFEVASTILPDKSTPSLVVESLADHRKIDHPKFMPVSYSETIDDRFIASMTIDLPVPVEESAPASLYLHRTSPNKLEIVERMGGSEKTEASVNLALKWLARHQHKDGHWDSRYFDKKCGECGGETDIEADVALTGLATLCFLGAGH